MRRRAPPRGYYEEDEQYEDEGRRDQYPRPPRLYRELEGGEDVDYRRRRSMPPVEELNRLHIRERPPRDFMRESFVPPRERGPVVMRSSREGVNEIPRESEREVYLRPLRERQRYPPREIDEERMMDIRDRERRGDRRRRSERDLVEDDMVIRRRRGPSFRDHGDEEDFRPRERFDDEGGEMYVQRSGPRRKPHGREEEIEEFLVDKSEGERPGFRKSHEGPRFDRGEELEEAVINDNGREWSRRRKSRGEPEVEEDLVLRGKERERPRDGQFREKQRHKEEMIIKWKDRASPDEMDREDEIQFREKRRHRRRSPPDPRLSREPPGSWPAEKDDGPDEEIRVRSRMRSQPRREEEEDDEVVVRHNGRDRHRAVDDDEGLIFRHKERDGRRASLGDDEIMLYKTKRRPPSRERSPSLKSIHAPPIHQDVITHHRHIDHGYDRVPRAPSVEISSTRTSFDEIDVHQRNNQDDHKSEEDIVLRHRGGEEPVFPTSENSLDFNKPWKPDPISSRRKPISLDDENEESLVWGSFPSRSKQSSPQDLDLDQNEDDEEEEEVVVHETRSAPRSRVRSPAGDLPDRPDEWSMVKRPVGAQVVTERRGERWTEVTKDLVVREAIEQLGYEFEETRMFYYIFSFMGPGDINELVGLSDEIRRARRRRIREMHRERASLPPRPSSLMGRMPPRPRMAGERRMREREWIIDSRR